MEVVEAVFCDLGGVVWQPSVAAMKAALERVGVDADETTLDRAAYAGIVAYDAAPDGDGFVGADRAYALSAGVPEDRIEDVLEHLRDAYSTGPWEARSAGDGVAALKALAATGVGVAIVSNASGSAEAELLEQAICQVGEGPGAQVAVVVDSGAAGVAKPDPAIFALALEATRTAPEHTVHVGDSLHFDVDGAAAAGITPLHFDPYDLCERDDHVHVHTLWDVVDLVNRARAPR